MILRRTRCEGVALLEVLLAVTVIGIGLGAVFQSLSDSARNESWLEREATARRLAADQFLLLRTSGALDEDGETGGRYEAPYADYSWSIRIRSAANLSSVSEAKLIVTYGEKNDRVYSIRTYLLRP